MTWMTITREDKVKQFNEAGDNKTHAEGGEVTTQLTVFTEEVVELLQAVQEYCNDSTLDNRANLCKEWADVQVTLSNLAWFFSIPADPSFNRVHESNMSKVVDGKVLYREDGKILKPEGYVPADMRGL